MFETSANLFPGFEVEIRASVSPRCAARAKK
jgi:hypothetical protein